MYVKPVFCKRCHRECQAKDFYQQKRDMCKKCKYWKSRQQYEFKQDELYRITHNV